MLALNLKTIYGFRQGKVSARRYASEQAKLKNRLSRGLQGKLETSLNKSVRIVGQTIREGGDPSIGAIVASLSEEIDAVLKQQIRRTFQTVYDYNDEKYSKISQKADYEGDGGFNFGRSARFDADVTDYFNARKPFFSNFAQGQGRHILLEVHNLRASDNNLDQIARKLTKQFKSINRNRAAVIARTETHSAQSFANDTYHRKVSDSFGVQMVKKWVSTADARTRRNHSMMNGETVQMDEDFVMPDGARMGYAGDPRGGASNVINCRCVILYVDGEDDAIDDREKVTVIDRGITIDENGLPVGLNSKELKDQIKSGKLTYGSAKKRMADRVKAAADSDGYGVAKGKTIYAGGKASQLGRDMASKYFPEIDQAANGTYIAIDQIFEEMAILADKFKIPELRGIKKIRKGSSAAASMGDGVLNVNVEYLAGDYARGLTKASAWSRSLPRSQKPYLTSEYFTSELDRLRSTLYHEFGHHIHQIKGISKRSVYRDGDWERYIKTDWAGRGGRKSSPSVYGDTKAVEWFAENFSIWAMGKSELADPDFIRLIKQVLKDDPDV